MTKGAEYISSDEEKKKELIGDFIYTYIEKLSDENSAPKITGMIIDLSEQDLIESVKTLASLKEKVDEGKKLLLEEENE